jgi:hypothetical protein
LQPCQWYFSISIIRMKPFGFNCLQQLNNSWILYFCIYSLLISKLLFEHEINDWLLKTEAFLRLMLVHQDLITLIFFPLTNNLVFDTYVCCIILYFQFWANMSFPMLISNTDSSLRKQVNSPCH